MSSILETYSIPEESEKLLWDGILRNPLHKSTLPHGITEAARLTSFTGSKLPFIPNNWRFAESISALKAFQGAMLNVLIHKKYNIDYQTVKIDTDHAQLFTMSPVHPWMRIDPEGENIAAGMVGDHDKAGYEKHFPNHDTHRTMEAATPFLGIATTNIYQLGDGRFYHIHGSLNPIPTQTAMGLSEHKSKFISSLQSACDLIEKTLSKYSAEQLDDLMNNDYRQAGTICYSIDEYRASEHGKANAHVGLYEVHHIPNPKQVPTWWNDVPAVTSPKRPLFGLKVVDLTRIIASPTIVRDLAEMGASIMRITAPHISDMSQLQLDMGWGKWNAYLDLRKDEDRKILRDLILEADVVVDGYRPGVMKKWGFGKEDIIEMCREREKGIVYARENCYGWNGPWSSRSGWQQISDANTGVSLEFGRAMGNDEPVTPVIPNTDFCTGVAGAIGILQALIERSEKGGSYVVDVALNYYTQWLTSSCGAYPKEIWDHTWTKYDRFVFRHADNMPVTIPKYFKMLQEHNTPIFDERYFEIRENKALGVPVQTVKPVVRFPKGGTLLGFNIGSRANGTDMAKWPKDLMIEIVA